MTLEPASANLGPPDLLNESAPASSCPTCAYAAEHGWWGADHRGTHCRDCHRSWAAKRQEHCTECHAHFAAAVAGDRHRVDYRDGIGRCLTPDEMLSHGQGDSRFYLDGNDVWHWGNPDRQNPFSDVRVAQRATPTSDNGVPGSDTQHPRHHAPDESGPSRPDERPNTRTRRVEPPETPRSTPGNPPESERETTVGYQSADHHAGPPETATPPTRQLTSKSGPGCAPSGGGC